MWRADANDWLLGLVERVGWELHLPASFTASLLIAVVQVCCTARDHEEYKMNDPIMKLAPRKQPQVRCPSDKGEDHIRH